MGELFDVLAIPETTCFACGGERRGVVGACPGCGKHPTTPAEWRSALSQNGYPLSDQHQSRTDGDARFDNPVFRAVNQRSLEQSLADKQLQELLGLDGRSPAVNRGVQSHGSTPSERTQHTLPKPSALLTENPFFALCASTLDSVAGIDGRVNGLDGQTESRVTSASVLESSSRLHAELRWLGSLPFEEAKALIEGEAAGLPTDPLASVNLQCFRLVSSVALDAVTVASMIGRISDTWTRISAAETRRTLNASRQRAGVRTIQDEATVTEALLERRDEVVADLVAVLDGLSSDELLQVYEAISGVARAPGKLAQALVSHYRAHAEPVMLAEGDKVVALCRRGANQLRNGAQLAPDFVSRLGALLAVYHRLLKPLRSSPQGLGVVRTLSRMMREAFTDLSDAAQQYADVEEAASLSSMQNTYFKRR